MHVYLMNIFSCQVLGEAPGDEFGSENIVVHDILAISEPYIPKEISFTSHNTTPNELKDVWC